MAEWTPTNMTVVQELRNDLASRVKQVDSDRDPYSIMEPAARGRMENRVRSSSPIAIHPLGDGTFLRSDDERLFHIKHELLLKYRELFEKTVVLDSGICLAPAVVGDASALLTMSGVPMNHVLQPPLNNEEVRKEMGLAEAFGNKRHGRIFDALCNIGFRLTLPHSVHINKLASSGPPLSVRDVGLKAQYVIKIGKNIDRVLNLIQDGDFVQLWKEYDIVFAHVHGERRQPDNVVIEWQGDKIVAYHGQERQSSQIREDGAIRLVIADKRIPSVLNVHFPAVAERVRVVWGTGAAMNLVHTAVWTQLLHGLINFMPFGLHHTGYTDFGKKISQSGHLIGLDMSQFDSTVSYDMSKRFFDNLAKHYDDRFVNSMRLMHHAPFWSASPERDVVDPKWYGNPWNPVGTAMNYGLPSGVAHNTYMGKVIGMWHTLCCFDDIRPIDAGYRDLSGAIVAIGQGKHALNKYMGSGDDTVAGSPDESYAHDFKSYVSNGGPKLFRLTTEDVIQFLGMVPFKYSENEKETHVCGNIISQDVKWLCAERGLDDKTYRQHAVTVGWDARNKLYALCPAYGELKTVRDEAFMKHVGDTPDNLVRQEIARLGAEATNAQYSETELLFIDKPARMHYMLDINDIRPELKDQAMTNLPMDTGMRLVGQMAKNRDAIYVIGRDKPVTLKQWLLEHPEVVDKATWELNLLNVIRGMAFTKQLMEKLRSNKQNKELDGEAARVDPNLHNVQRSSRPDHSIGVSLADAPDIIRGRRFVKHNTSRRTQHEK